MVRHRQPAVVAPVKRALVYLWCYQRKRQHQKRPRTAEVRNVAGLSYTTSRAFIFPSSSRFWASNSAIAALVDTGPLAHLIAALLCRSKDAAGEPQWNLVGRSVARMTTRSVTRLKLVTQGSPAASSKLALTHASPAPPLPRLRRRRRPHPPRRLPPLPPPLLSAGSPSSSPPTSPSSTPAPPATIASSSTPPAPAPSPSSRATPHTPDRRRR